LLSVQININSTTAEAGETVKPSYLLGYIRLTSPCDYLPAVVDPRRHSPWLAKVDRSSASPLRSPVGDASVVHSSSRTSRLPSSPRLLFWRGRWAVGEQAMAGIRAGIWAAIGVRLEAAADGERGTDT